MSIDVMLGVIHFDKYFQGNKKLFTSYSKALTATATVELRKEVAGIISMKNELVVSVSPLKANIAYAVRRMISVQETVSSLVTVAAQEAISMPKIINCQSKDDCANLYIH